MDSVVDENIKVLRHFMIKTLKRYMMEMDFMKNVVTQNSNAFESEKDMLEQFDRIKNDFKALIDYTFYPVEIEAVEKLDLE